MSAKFKPIATDIYTFEEMIKSNYLYVDKTDCFVLMTGVAKFTKVSIFSKLNSLFDITMDAHILLHAGLYANTSYCNKFL